MIDDPRFEPITIATDWCKNDNLVAQNLLRWMDWYFEISSSHNIQQMIHTTSGIFLNRLQLSVSFSFCVFNSGKHLKRTGQGLHLASTSTSTRHSHHHGNE
jgi:hypothetical protein